MSIDAASVIISAVSLVVGIALSVIAIWLSMHFFGKSKDAETASAAVLAEIKSQVSQLASINDKLFGRALQSLSQIAKQKVEAQSVLINEQISATITGMLAGTPREAPAVLASQNTESSSQGSFSGLENAITGHNLPNLRDPFTLTDLNREYIGILINSMNFIGWVNNYGQQALLNFGTGTTSLERETANNLDQSANSYRNIKAQIEKLQTERPELFTNHPAMPLYKSTVERLDALIRNYDEMIQLISAQE